MKKKTDVINPEIVEELLKNYEKPEEIFSRKY